MSKWHDLLAKHAMFPFPPPRIDLSASATDISRVDAGMIADDWKAKYALRDDSLVEELCQTLESILGEDSLEPRLEENLLKFFAPKIEFDEVGLRKQTWSENPSEARSRKLLDIVFDTAERCLWLYGKHILKMVEEHQAEKGSSRVDYLILVDDLPSILCEAKSPSVMQTFCSLLPPRGIELTWEVRQPLTPRILTKVALYLGLREMEWLFITCHNFWVVCRLVRDADKPYLAYSRMVSMENSSTVPFRALFGAMLSVLKGVPVKSNPYNSDLALDIVDEVDDSPSPEGNSDDGSEYRDGSEGGTATSPRVTRNRTRDSERNIDSLMITASSPKSPEESQIWVHLYAMANNPLVLPPCARSSKPRLWLTRFMASGSTGNVWEGRFNNSDNLFAAKTVEVLRRSDIPRRQRLRNEFDIYLTLDEAHRSNKLRDPIAPRCYGAFEGNMIDVLVLDLCGSILKGWHELTTSERNQVYHLVKELHNLGIVHGDLEPRNIARTHGGGFRLLDFSESRRHICKESKVGEAHFHHASDKNRKCSELQALRKSLWQPLQNDRVNWGENIIVASDSIT